MAGLQHCSFVATDLENKRVLKDKKRDLINEKESVNSRNQTLQIEIAACDKESRELQSALKAKRSLSTRCGKMSEQAQRSKTELACRAMEYQNLKEAAGQFLLWAERLQSRAELMESFDEEEDISRGLLRLVGDLERCESEEVRKIYSPLKALLEHKKE